MKLDSFHCMVPASNFPVALILFINFMSIACEWFNLSMLMLPKLYSFAHKKVGKLMFSEIGFL